MIIGPKRPTRDGLDRPLNSTKLPKRCGLLQPESIEDIPALADDLLGACGDLEEDFIAPEQEHIDCTTVRTESGKVLLVVANHDARDARAELICSKPMRDPYSGERLLANRSGVCTLSLKQRQVRLFFSEE